jgi:hypothetical protein
MMRPSPSALVQFIRASVGFTYRVMLLYSICSRRVRLRFSSLWPRISAWVWSAKSLTVRSPFLFNKEWKLACACGPGTVYCH